MKIRLLTATFGKLQRQTLELKDGLNIIEAPNEAGKSTWAGFLRAMLYGIDTKERDKKGIIAEKNRYQPWDGGAMEGLAQLSWNEREITLRRTSKANSPMSQFQAVYTGTEEPVPGLTADSVGEALTGVGREVFERSAFVGQSAVAVTGSAELERRISAIVSSGQEDVSYSETEQRLRDWKNRRYSNQKNGLIPRLEAENAQISALLAQLDRANRQAAAARAKILELQSEQALLEKQAQAHRELANAQARARYDAAKLDLDQAQAAMNSVRHELQRRGTLPCESVLREIQGELSYLNTLESNIKQALRELEGLEVPSMHIPHPVFADMEPAAARARAQTDAETAANSRKNASALKTRIWSVLLILVGIGLLLLSLLPETLPSYLRGILYILCGASLCLFGVIQLRIHRKKLSAAGILAAYGAQNTEDILAQAEEYTRQWEDADRIRTEAAVRAVTLERLKAEREELTERLLTRTHTFAPEATDLYGVSAAVSLALSLEEKERSAALRLDGAEKVLQAITAHGIPEAVQAPELIPSRSEQEITSRLVLLQGELSRQGESLAMAQGEINTLGDYAALQAQLNELNLELSRRREEYDAILLAMDVLRQANAQLQERMSPALNAKSGELFHRLTGGIYDQVSLTREFEALAGRQGDVTPKKLLSLSKGTADQLYLAVRLAVCELVLPGNDPAPLILDDALVNFDDERLHLALDLLRSLSARRQILLFTCQSRERLYLDGAEGVHVMRLQS